MKRLDREMSIRFGLAVLWLGFGAAGCADQQDAPAAGGQANDTATATAMSARDSFTIADVGLETPESVLHDPDADVYLVSNVSGDPLAKDDNGFIARISPDGSVEELRWIDGAAESVTLNAPKGMAVRGDTLYVADIDTLRMFHRRTGEPLGAIGVPGATFLNDVAVGNDAVYVADSGLTTGFAPSGTDAVYRIEDGRAVAIAEGESLNRPNGLAVTPEGLIVVPFGGAAITRIALDGGAPATGDTLPTGQLDGVVALPDGDLLVSSWAGNAVYRISPDTITTLVSDVEAPADIGYDESRGRVLIPLFNANRVVVRTVR